jgi:hypothetical protein
LSVDRLTLSNLGSRQGPRAGFGLHVPILINRLIPSLFSFPVFVLVPTVCLWLGVPSWGRFVWPSVLWAPHTSGQTQRLSPIPADPSAAMSFPLHPSWRHTVSCCPVCHWVDRESRQGSACPHIVMVPLALPHPHFSRLRPPPASSISLEGTK